MYWKHWPTWEYTILFISIIPLPALIGYHIQPRRNSVQKSPYSSGLNSCRYRRVHFCMLPLEPDINHSFFNKTPVFGQFNNILSVLCHSVKMGQMFCLFKSIETTLCWKFTLLNNCLCICHHVYLPSVIDDKSRISLTVKITTKWGEKDPLIVYVRYAGEKLAFCH